MIAEASWGNSLVIGMEECYCKELYVRTTPDEKGNRVFQEPSTPAATSKPRQQGPDIQVRMGSAILTTQTYLLPIYRIKQS